MLFWVEPGEDRKRAACGRYRKLGPFRVRVQAGYNLIGFNRKALMDDDRLVTRRDLNGLEPEFKRFADTIAKRIREMETKLVTAFHEYARANTAQIQGEGFSEAANAARIEALEGRVLELETRQGR